MTTRDADRRRYQRIALGPSAQRTAVRVQVGGKDVGVLTDVSYGGVGVDLGDAAKLPSRLVVTVIAGTRRMKIPVIVARQEGRNAGLALDFVRLSPQGRAFIDGLLVDAVRG